MRYQGRGQCRTGHSECGCARQELADAAEKLVREHYREKFSLVSLADTLHVDKSYLLRTFKLVKGTTLLSFHNQVRCEAARELLTCPEFSVSSIASAVGFVSPAHFSHIFRKYNGVTPSEYRESCLTRLSGKKTMETFCKQLRCGIGRF
ncbi:MAG: helix-turn-helix transcriptional regulator [Stomatobaculum sp.]|nr:helix-turn-helix transcriptional regulator [Stomatobaculum sp.]